jgi:hypothetical protein
MRMNVQSVRANGTRGPNPLRQLLELGQSVWLDYIRQSLISSGELQRLIHDDGLRAKARSRCASATPITLAVLKPPVTSGCCMTA